MPEVFDSAQSTAFDKTTEPQRLSMFDSSQQGFRALVESRGIFDVVPLTEMEPRPPTLLTRENMVLHVAPSLSDPEIFPSSTQGGDDLAIDVSGHESINEIPAGTQEQLTTRLLYPLQESHDRHLNT